jgi:hypothetical protein
MPKRNWLLIASIAGIVLATVLFLGYVVLFSASRNYSPAELSITRDSVGESMAVLLPAEVESADDPALLKAASRLAGKQYVSWVWISDKDGKIVSAQGGPAQEGDTLETLSSNEVDIVDAVEPGLLSGPAEMQLRLAVAIRREGEHNDVFRHIVRSIQGTSGEPAAYVAVAYDASPRIGAPPGLLEQAALGLILAGFAGYWLCLPLWVTLDARARAERASAWGLLILFTNLAGFIAYLLFGRQAPS